MKKIFFLLFSLFFLAVKPVLAADLNVDCTDSSCTLSPLGPVFSETNIYPGWNSATKTIKAINNSSGDANFAIETVNFNDPGRIGDVLNIVIKESGALTDLYNDLLTNFDTLGYKILSGVSKGANKDYDFTVFMLTSADNQYQGKTLVFDLNLGFELVPLPATSPGPTSTSTPGPCTTPSVPTGLTATPLSSTTISLNWAASAGSVDHYAISYGLSPGSYIYGAANIGNVTSYVISGLSSGTTYYFVVYAVSNCGSSGASTETNATTGGILGAFVAPGPALGFKVLGEETPGEVGEIAGEKAKSVCPWWWILSLAEACLLGFYYRRLGKKENRRTWWILPIALAILAYIGDHFIAHRYFIPSRFCPLMWLWAILAGAIPIGFYLYFNLTKKIT